MTANLKCSGHSSVIWPILIILYTGWSPLALRLQNLPVSLPIIWQIIPITISINVTFSPSSSSSSFSSSFFFFFFFLRGCPSVLADGLPMEFPWQLISSGLQELFQYSGRSLQCGDVYDLESSSDFHLFQCLFQAFRNRSKWANYNGHHHHPHISHIF